MRVESVVLEGLKDPFSGSGWFHWHIDAKPISPAYVLISSPPFGEKVQKMKVETLSRRTDKTADGLAQKAALSMTFRESVGFY